MSAQRRIPRVYLPGDNDGGTIKLGQSEAHYLRNVLRLQAGDLVQLFDGRGREIKAQITDLTRRGVLLTCVEKLVALPRSKLAVTLVQALIKADAMDIVVQKATELGIECIRPTVTEHSAGNLHADRVDRKIAHWRNVARSACEQSGRHWLPDILAPAPLTTCLAELADFDLRIVLDPSCDRSDRKLRSPAARVALFVGPEGGFSDAELLQMTTARCAKLRFGPRVLRAETAAIVACAYAQHRWGDLG